MKNELEINAEHKALLTRALPIVQHLLRQKEVGQRVIIKMGINRERQDIIIVSPENDKAPHVYSKIYEIVNKKTDFLLSYKKCEDHVELGLDFGKFEKFDQKLSLLEDELKKWKEINKSLVSKSETEIEEEHLNLLNRAVLILAYWFRTKDVSQKMEFRLGIDSQGKDIVCLEPDYILDGDKERISGVIKKESKNLLVVTFKQHTYEVSIPVGQNGQVNVIFSEVEDVIKKSGFTYVYGGTDDIHQKEKNFFVSREMNTQEEASETHDKSLIDAGLNELKKFLDSGGYIEDTHYFPFNTNSTKSSHKSYVDYKKETATLEGKNKGAVEDMLFALNRHGLMEFVTYNKVNGMEKKIVINLVGFKNLPVKEDLQIITRIVPERTQDLVGGHKNQLTQEKYDNRMVKMRAFICLGGFKSTDFIINMNESSRFNATLGAISVLHDEHVEPMKKWFVDNGFSKALLYTGAKKTINVMLDLFTSPFVDTLEYQKHSRKTNKVDDEKSNSDVTIKPEEILVVPKNQNLLPSSLESSFQNIQKLFADKDAEIAELKETVEKLKGSELNVDDLIEKVWSNMTSNGKQPLIRKVVDHTETTIILEKKDIIAFFET